jgi:hypothetical protein
MRFLRFGAILVVVIVVSLSLIHLMVILIVVQNFHQIGLSASLLSDLSSPVLT